MGLCLNKCGMNIFFLILFIDKNIPLKNYEIEDVMNMVLYFINDFINQENNKKSKKIKSLNIALENFDKCTKNSNNKNEKKIDLNNYQEKEMTILEEINLKKALSKCFFLNELNEETL